MEKYKKSVLLVLIWVSSLLALGCSSRVHKVNLAQPTTTKAIQNIEVVDARSDKQLVFAGIAYSSEVHTYLLNVVPAEVEVIRGFLSQLLDGAVEGTHVKVQLTSLEIAGKIGFATNDELLCLIETKVSVNGKKEKEETLIKSSSKNTSHFWGGTSTTAGTILDQCLQEHSKVIAAYVLKEK